ncbi:hypothetical protein WDW89_20955 [Deltaproteobacteria bacterium TL4]
MSAEFQKCLQAFALATKQLAQISERNVGHRQILLDHARCCLLAYSMKNALNMPPAASKKLVQAGFQSLKNSQLPREEDIGKLHDRYLEIIVASD